MDHDPLGQPDYPGWQDRGQLATYCDRCGSKLAAVVSGHETCQTARELEPPRYCGCCGRRTVVKVTPAGWSSRCSRHGLAQNPET